MSNVKIWINNQEMTVPSTYTVLDAANDADIYIPRLCFLKDISETSACRLCVVEIEGLNTLKNSCTVQVWEGMKVHTNTKRVNDAVKNNLKLLAANHHFECWVCHREENCELLELLRRYNVPNTMGEDPTFSKKTSYRNISNSLTIDTSKCILCGRCVSACNHYTGLGILDFNKRGFDTYVAPANNDFIDDAGCLYCGKCIQACPVGALSGTSDEDIVIDYLNNDNYYVIAQVAPAVRAALGEEFGNPIGTNVEGKIYRALNKMGFDEITDVNFAADVTILEEGTELIGRIQDHLQGKEAHLPLFTSCSPGWIRYIERYYPEYLPHLSTAKSPQQIQGALIKHIYADIINVPKERIKVVSFMPCIAKKDEADREQMKDKGVKDVDAVLTTREFARLIRRFGINFNNLQDYKPESPLATYTGAGAIFGTTGGVMEAALRTVKAFLEKEDKHTIDFTQVRGSVAIKEADLVIDNQTFKVAVVHGAANFPEMFRRIKEKPNKYIFVEFMGCEGGCINGGGQPIVKARDLETIDVCKLRAQALYTIDSENKIRRSHENPNVVSLYQTHLGKPGGELAHKLLHTTYSKKEVFGEKK